MFVAITAKIFLSYNYMLQAKSPVFIAIEGPIGVGKSALIDTLEKEYGKNGIRTFKEELDPNPFLSKFYEDKKRYALQTQIAFMLSRYKQYENLQKVMEQPDMFSKLYVSDFIFEKNDIFAELTIEDEHEWKLYHKIKETLENDKNFTKPTFIVYLRAGEKTLYHRIQARYQQTIQLNAQTGAESVKNISQDYLKQLTALYDRYFFHYKQSPVLIIDVNKTDFVHTAPNTVSSTSIILDAIKKYIKNPPSQNTYIKLDD